MNGLPERELLFAENGCRGLSNSVSFRVTKKDNRVDFRLLFK